MTSTIPAAAMIRTMVSLRLALIPGRGEPGEITTRHVLAQFGVRLVQRPQLGGKHRRLCLCLIHADARRETAEDAATEVFAIPQKPARHDAPLDRD